MKFFKQLLQSWPESQGETVADKPTITQQLIEQIHNEFNTAGELLLAQANEALGIQQPDTNKAERLRKLGFTATDEVKKAEQIAKQRTMAKQLADRVQYFNLHYPSHKFIDKESVLAICEKYNLVLGQVSYYKGFVPEKNLKEIEGFRLREEDEVYFRRTWREIEYVTKKEYDAYWTNRKLVYEQGDPIPSTTITEFYEKGMPLQICAPIKDMDMINAQLKGREIVHVPDPVVLQPVNGGYLIVTAWGDEASDPLVQNPKHN